MAATLSELRDALAALGLSTVTNGLRGEERRAELQRRLEGARGSCGVDKGDPHAPEPTVPMAPLEPAELSRLSLTELRVALEQRGLSTQTPGLRGDARRHAMIQRLLNSSDTQPLQSARKLDDSGAKEPQQQPRDDGGQQIQSSRSSVSSYSAASEFLFYESTTMSTQNQPAEIQTAAPTTHRPPPSIPALRLSPAHGATGSANAWVDSTASLPLGRDSNADLCRRLEAELVELRSELHSQRSARSLSIEHRLRLHGFTLGLDELSATMEALEKERQRLLRLAFPHELVITTAMTGVPRELVQEDAVRLIERRQQQLRVRINATREAMTIVGEDHVARTSEEGLLVAIQRVETQIKVIRAASSPRSSNSSASTACDEVALIPSVLTRCRSMPHLHFHNTWISLPPEEQSRLHHELRTAKSFRVRHDRLPVGSWSSPVDGKSTLGRGMHVSIQSFKRYPPTTADKLGIKALFLEQSHRGLIEINRVYREALMLEPENSTVLGCYARFLHQRCGKSEQAAEYYDRAIQADPTNSVNVAMFANFLHHNRRDYTLAEQVYLRAIALTPHDPILLGDYASLLKKTSSQSKLPFAQLNQAKQLLDQALKLQPSNVVNKLHYAAVLAALGDSEQAQMEYEILLERFQQIASPENPDSSPRTLEYRSVHATVCGNYANFLKNHGHMDRANELYQRAIRLNPHDATVARN